MIDANFAMALWARTVLRSDLPTGQEMPVHFEVFTLAAQSFSTIALSICLKCQTSRGCPRTEKKEGRIWLNHGSSGHPSHISRGGVNSRTRLKQLTALQPLQRGSYSLSRANAPRRRGSILETCITTMSCSNSSPSHYSPYQRVCMRAAKDIAGRKHTLFMQWWSLLLRQCLDGNEMQDFIRAPSCRSRTRSRRTLSV